MKHTKRYWITYYSATTGYGWEDECRTIREARARTRYLAQIESAHVDVWDTETHEQVFLKAAGKFKPDIDWE